MNYSTFQFFDIELSDGYSRNVSCALNLISTFLLNKKLKLTTDSVCLFVQLLRLLIWQTRRTNTVPFSYKCFIPFSLTYNFCYCYVDLDRLKEFVEYNTNSWSIVRYVMNITPTGSIYVSVTIRGVLYDILHPYSVK
jgi:hypothetical protein